MALERVRQAWFNLIHTSNLVYNTCWEDPRLDRAAMALRPSDEVLVITSAGCNALDYCMGGAGRVHAVDMNPFQNALLELKLAAARTLEYDDFFVMFGRGRSVDWQKQYTAMRPHLSETSQGIWDRRGEAYFSGPVGRRSFYFRGSSGTFAWLVNGYVNRVAKLREAVRDLLDARSVSEQQTIFQEWRLAERLFRPLVRFLLRRDTTLAMLGVPRSQRRQLDEQYSGGIVQFIMDRVQQVLTQMTLSDNYFWRVYLTGEYTPDCSPEYLKEANFQKLREARDRFEIRTDSVLGYLNQHAGQINRFVLLDHMDWLHENHRDVLAQEWQAIVNKSSDNARVLWRSAGFNADFIDPIRVQTEDGTRSVGELLTYHRELASELHQADRVNTYGSFYIADLNKN
jgi:S-adenosylmethionine-diacylglycerol 3-amino-3-carboxypropyl transferase